MQYKIDCIDSDWLPKEGGIKLWKEDDFGKPLLPGGEPLPLAPNCMKNLDDIVKGLGSFINLWDTMGASDSVRQYQQKHEYLSYYWKDVKDSLGKAMEPDSHMKNGFWPHSRVSTSVVDQYEDDGVLCEEFAQDAPYVGQRHHRLAESFCVA